MKVNLDLVKGIPANHIIDEHFTGVGSSKFSLAHDRFRGSTDMVIRTAAGGGGTLLTETTDYALEDLDTGLTTRVTANVYASVHVTNPTYQSGSLYISYWAVADVVDAGDQYSVERTSAQYVKLNSNGSVALASTFGFTLDDDSGAYLHVSAAGDIDLMTSTGPVLIGGTGGGSFGTAIAGSTIGWLQFKSGGGFGDYYNTSFGAFVGGVEILANRNSGTGNIILNSKGGGVVVLDSLMSTPFRISSQANAVALATEFAYDSQTDFNWSVRTTGTTAISSLLGALNANRQDLYEYVELLRTQGAVVGVAAGANLVGTDGITGVIPTGKSTGDAANLQEMLEGIFNSLNLNKAYLNGAAVTVNGSSPVWTLASSKSFTIADATDAAKFVVNQGTAADSISIATTGGVTITAAANVKLATNLLPDANGARDIGSASYKFANIWAQTGHFDTGSIYLGTSTVLKVAGGRFQVAQDGANYEEFAVKGNSKLLVYYGWLSIVNSATSNAEAAAELAYWDYIVLGAGLQDSGHTDYANTVAIVALLKQIKPDIKLFGYLDVGVTTNNYNEAAMEIIVDDWATVGVHGIFMDNFGYDFQVPRSRQNTIVTYVHSKPMLTFVNAWDPDDAFSSAVNVTYNPSGIATVLRAGDYYLSESFVVNTNAFSGNGGYQTQYDIKTKSDKIVGYVNTLGIIPMACGIVESATSTADRLKYWDTLQALSLIFGFKGYGLQAYLYGASGALSGKALKFDYVPWASEFHNTNVKYYIDGSWYTFRRNKAGHTVEAYVKDTTGPWYGSIDVGGRTFSDVVATNRNLSLSTIYAGNITVSAAGYTEVLGDFRIPTSVPGSPSTGSMYIDAAANKLYVYYASAWHYTTMT